MKFTASAAVFQDWIDRDMPRSRPSGRPRGMNMFYAAFPQVQARRSPPSGENSQKRRRDGLFVRRCQ